GSAAATNRLGGSKMPLRIVQPVANSKVRESLSDLGEGAWTPVRKGSSGVGGQMRGGEGSLQCDGFGSRFRLLDEAGGPMNSSCRGDEIAAIVGQQLEDILGPFPPPTT
ncbi:hypothetical protein Dimus_006287, partial [Dionaea muscipula]